MINNNITTKAPYIPNREPYCSGLIDITKFISHQSKI